MLLVHACRGILHIKQNEAQISSCVVKCLFSGTACNVLSFFSPCQFLYKNPYICHTATISQWDSFYCFNRQLVWLHWKLSVWLHQSSLCKLSFVNCGHCRLWHVRHVMQQCLYCFFFFFLTHLDTFASWSSNWWFLCKHCRIERRALWLVFICQFFFPYRSVVTTLAAENFLARPQQSDVAGRVKCRHSS